MAWNHLARGEKSSAQKCFAVPWGLLSSSGLFGNGNKNEMVMAFEGCKKEVISYYLTIMLKQLEFVVFSIGLIMSNIFSDSNSDNNERNVNDE